LRGEYYINEAGVEHQLLNATITIFLCSEGQEEGFLLNHKKVYCSSSQN